VKRVLSIILVLGIMMLSTAAAAATGYDTVFSDISGIGQRTQLKEWQTWNSQRCWQRYVFAG